MVSAAVVRKFEFPAICGGGMETSIVAMSIDAMVFSSEAVSSVAVLFFEGRPLFGLTASGAPSRLNAGFTSPQARRSILSEPSLFSPTLMTKVLLVGLERISNGPFQLF